MKEKRDMQWIMLRLHFSYGSTQWSYEYIAKEDIISYVERIADSHNHSDKFRGVEYKKLVKPQTKSLVKKYVKYLEGRKEAIVESLNDMTEMIDQVKTYLRGPFDKVKPICKRCGHQYCKGQKIKKNSQECKDSFVTFKR